jgi:hypothetical protein
MRRMLVSLVLLVRLREAKWRTGRLGWSADMVFV